MSTPSRFSLIGGRLIDPANGIDGITDLHIADGRIAAVGAPPPGFRAEARLDADGRIVCPGLVDLCARLREPGAEQKGTIASETRAAAAGGITTLCAQPDTDPVIDTPADAELIRRRARQQATARVLPVGALTMNLDGERLSEMAALRDAGCVALSDGGRPLDNTRVIRRLMEYAATFDILCMLHPMDAQLCDGGCAHEGAVSARLGLPGIPEAAETVAVARNLALAAHTGSRLHLRGLSCATAAVMLRRARHDRVRVSADVAAHQLFLTEMDIDGFDSSCHVIPPLRTLADRDGLRHSVAVGAIGAISSDHQPHEADAKLAPFPETEPGISGLETLLPLVLKLVDEGLLTLPEAIARVTQGPAEILGLPLGRLNVGASADICVFDPEATWRLRAADLHSRGHNTPFDGWEFRGRVLQTFFEGRLTFEQRP